MASSSRDILADLERHTQLLGANVAKLAQALDHWRLLEAEYDALAEEVRQAQRQFADQPQAQQADLVRIRRDFDGQLVDHKTVCELFGARLGQPITRSVDQIAGAIGRRLDYVHQNAATLQKQVEAAANKLAAAQVVSRPGMPIGGEGDEDGEDGGGDGEEGFEPVTDIVEELDDDDNVINVQLNTPSRTQPQVLEALQKAGIDEIPAGGPAEAKAAAAAREEADGEKQKGSSSSQSQISGQAQQQKEQQPASASSSRPRPKPKPAPRKGVSFADDTKPGHHDEPSPQTQPKDFAVQRLEKVMRAAKDQESMVSSSSATIPQDESEEDAALRREMLEYSMSEIGPIVAQLDLDEDSYNEDDDGSYEDDDDYDEEYDEDDDEDDKFGRSKYSVIDEAYRERMRELEKKLGVAALPNTSILKPEKENGQVADEVAESLGRIRVSGADGADVSGSRTTSQSTQPVPITSVLKESSTKSKGKKSSGDEPRKVSFASSLDIAPVQTAPAVAAPSSQKAAGDSKSLVDPLSDVVERGSRQSSQEASAPAPPETKKAKKPSRFMMAREGAGGGASANAGAIPTEPQLPKGPHQAPVRFLDQDRTVAPSGPEGKTLAEAVVERETAGEPKEPDELDANILLQETATQYHRTRNRLIQKEGGFLKASESAVVPLDESEGGPRISKFKAARLGNQFMSP